MVLESKMKYIIIGNTVSLSLSSLKGQILTEFGMYHGLECCGDLQMGLFYFNQHYVVYYSGVLPHSIPFKVHT